MSFTFHERPTFEWPVVIQTPVSGGFDEVTITGLFEMVDESDHMRIDPDINTPSQHIEAEVTRLLDVFKGWTEGDVLDREGKPWPATAENVAAFLRKRPHRMAVAEAYNAAITPSTGHRAKN